MATPTGTGHSAPAVPGLTSGGTTPSAALPAIGPSVGTVLGRERSGTNALCGLPRKETSYASSTASKISIASLPLDTLEHIIEDFKAQQHSGKHRFGAGRSAAAQHSVRINLSPSPPPQPGVGRTNRTWNGIAASSGATGGGPGRWHGSGPSSMSFTFNARPSTPPGLGVAPPAVAASPPVLPGLPPGTSVALSSRAAAVLQNSGSAAHLQRFLALDSGQLENHFIIASPSGAPIMDLQEICFDGAASVDGLPSNRDAVVVLTSSPDGVPVPRVISLDQPGMNSIRRSGTTAVIAAAGSAQPPVGSNGATYGVDTSERHLKSGGSSGSHTAHVDGGPPASADQMMGGAYSTEVDGDTTPMRLPFSAVVPLSPQRSSVVGKEFGNATTVAAAAVAIAGGSSCAVPSRTVILGGGSPATGSWRRSETGATRTANSLQSSSTPLSPLLRLAPSSPSPSAVHMQQTHHHVTSTYSMLPSLADGGVTSASMAASASSALTAAGGSTPSVGGYASSRKAGLHIASAGGLGLGRHRRGSSEALPVLVRMNSSDHAPATGLTTGVTSVTMSREETLPDSIEAEAGDGYSGGVDLQTAAASGVMPGDLSWSAHSVGTGTSTAPSPRQWSGGRPGGMHDGLLSPSRARLQAKINTLQNERERSGAVTGANLSSQLSGHLSLQSSAPGAPNKGVSFGSARNPALTGLTGMELVKVALQQVETGERTLADPQGRGTGSGSLDSYRTPRSSITGSGAVGSVPPAAPDTARDGPSEEPPPSSPEVLADLAAEALMEAPERPGSAPAAPPSVVVAPLAAVDEAAAQRVRAQSELEEREEAAAAERRQARLVRSLTKLLTTGRGRRPVSAHSVASEASRKRLLITADESSASDDDLDFNEEESNALDQSDGGAKPTRPSHRSPPPPLPAAASHAAPLTHSGSSRPASGSDRIIGEQQDTAMAQTGPGGEADLTREEGDGNIDGEPTEDSLDAAAAVAADGGLDAEALLEFAQQLDRANMEFRLVEAARERARRVEALLTQAALAVQQQRQPHAPMRRRSSIAGDTSAGAVPVPAGASGQRVESAQRDSLDLILLARRREGVKPHNVTQVICSLEAPLDKPMEVDLDALLKSIEEALQMDEQDVQATRFDETFRIRTERYLAQLCRLNPAAFEEVSAAQAEADYRSSVERAKLRLRQLHGEVAGEPLTSAGKPKNQYDKAVVMLQAHRPFFLPPVISREAVERAPVPPMLGGRGSTRPPWDVYASIFRERKRSDARDLYDNDMVLATQFNLDWSRTVSKMLFMKLVAREDLGVRQLQVRGKNGRAALEQELSQVREALAEAFGMIRSTFTYYSIATPEEIYAAAISAAVANASASGGRAEAAAAEVAAAAAAAAIRRGGTAGMASGNGTRAQSPEAARTAEVPSVAESAAAAVAAAAAAAAAADGGPNGGYGILEMDEQRWLAFCTSAGITGRTPGVRVSDLRLLFWTVNREEERNMTLESVENNDNAFMRFEFMEALVRAAFGRYITPGTLRDASDATRRLIKHLRSSLPPMALVDPNDFRRSRLYTAEMEVAIVHNLELLTASFKLYKARDRAKYLGVDHWMSFLETNNLMALHMGGLSPTEAKLIFAWSQMVVVDELKLRRRAVSLQLWDFVEAVARLSERVALPNTDEMDRWMLYNLNIGRNTPLPPGHTRVWTYCNALASGRGGTGLERRPSGRELLPSPPPTGCPPTRPLAVKFRLLMEYLAGSLADAWGGNNTHETAQSMLRTANMLCGGVELA